MFDEMKAGSCENTSNRISLPKTIRPCTPHGPQQINNGWLRQPTALRNSSPKYLYSLSASGFLFPNSSSQRIFKTCDRYGSKFSSLKWTWNKHGNCHDTAEKKNWQGSKHNRILWQLPLAITNFIFPATNL